MQVQVEAGAIHEVTSDLIVIGLYQGAAPTGATAAVDAVLGGAISELTQSEDFKGKAEQTALLYPRGAISARRVLLVGLGERAKFSADVARRVAGAVARKARELHLTRYHAPIYGAEGGELDPVVAVQSIVEGTILGSYSFYEHKTDVKEQAPLLESLTLMASEVTPALERAAADGTVIADAVCLARNLANQPANYMTPTMLAEVAEELANEVGLTCQVLEEANMAELGMGALLGVAQGSNEPAKFIVLEHNAGRPDLPTYCVVGKGITFDAGGISLKPGEGMEAMKGDMSGAAITLGVMRVVAALGLPLHVVGLLPATENLPDGRAYKPGDVLKSMSGQTIEIISTDAEGRLILADALHYAKRYNPRAVVDLATLTGACVVALGHAAAGLMGNDAALIQALKQASATTGEKAWELPLYEEYAEALKSDVADIRNSGGRAAGASVGGVFLSKFATGYPWAHLDIAGTSWAEATSGYQVKGPSAAGLRLVVQWLRTIAQAG